MDDTKVQELQQKLQSLQSELQQHAAQVTNPKCAALCETSAEVLAGLATAFQHYQTKSEAAWA